MIDVYTDGSGLGGIGVVFPSRPDLNISEKFEAENPTNQRCELMVIREALAQILDELGDEIEVKIHTDSKYSIGCFTDWVKNWEKNGWINSKKEPVKNQDIIKSTLKLIREFKTPPTFVHVYGHKGNKYNEEADILAKLGSSK